jgi:hypothetical protein
MRQPRRKALGLLSIVALGVALALGTTPARAQLTMGISADYLGYSFDDGLGAKSIQLFMVPVALRYEATSTLAFDASAAWAEGRVEKSDTRLELVGPTDTSLRVAYQATPWALLTLGVNVPTGKSQHDSDEAIVAGLLATDLLGFREASWGRGLAVTSSLAVAGTVGALGIGVAGAYSLRGEFNPSEEQADLEYRPGNEARVRLGIDRNFGNSTLTLGGTFINYTDDQADGRNLFKAGNRFQFDASYAWRMGGGVWTVYAADLLRQNGDRTLTVLDAQGDSIGVATEETPRQNLAAAGVVGAVRIGGGFVFRPHLDFKYQTREDATGSKAGSGWVAAFGGDIPVRIFGGLDFVPKARVLVGSIQGSEEEGVSLFGLEFRGTVRTAF